MDNTPLLHNNELHDLRNAIHNVRTEMHKVIVGQEHMIDLMLIALLTHGHVLLEGVPGIAKTLSAKMLAKCLSVNFSRIQFTPDLMPTDVVGTSVFNLKTSEFVFNAGPVFSNFVLIDEINRAPAKTQSALFEAMEERQVTIDGQTYPLQAPFFIVATQNPIEQEGTYKLPEAQLDRFIFRIKLPYPTLKQETAILSRYKDDFSQRTTSTINSILNPSQLQQFTNTIERVHIKDELLQYIANIIHNTRNNGDIYLGASPRASLAILRTSKAAAAIHGRDFVTPDDIQYVIPHVLNHRIILAPEREMEGTTPEDIIRQIIEQIEVPR